MTTNPETGSLTLSDEARPLIQAKSFDTVESLWMNRLESSPTEVDDFLAVAKMLRQSEERSRADALLELLADTLKELGAWPERLRVLRELGRLAKKPATFRPLIEEALTKTHGHRPSFKKTMQFIGFSDPASNPLERAEKLEAWIAYDVGGIYFMPGRGAGIVTELNPDLGICRLDFEKAKRVSVPLNAAHKYLTPLPPGHILRKKVESPDELKTQAVSSPSQTFEAILRGFERPMSASEVKDTLIGVISDEKWSSWWTSARKHPQIVIAGAGSKATYSWSSSAGAAEGSIKREFLRGNPREKLELARKHSSRSGELADYFSSSLAEQAAKIARTDPGLAWEITAVLEKLPGKFTPQFDATSLLEGPLASRIVTSINDRTLRERAVDTIRQQHPDWARVYSELFFLDDDIRVLAKIMAALEESGNTELPDRLVDETLRYPRRHPTAFYWYCKTLVENEKLPERAGNQLLLNLLEATGSDEFGSLKPRMREFFDRGGLAVRIVMNNLTEDQARKIVETLERYGSVEEYRREVLRAAALMKYPDLREPQAEPIFATPEMLAAKRQEFERLRTVEMPANLKAIQEAREMGDLRENFEYKAARQRQEYLTARVSELSAEMNLVRVLDPAQVDTSEVRVGTKIVLRNGDVRREVTVLGPWESSPEHGVYSNQSDVANALMGNREGDIVTFMGNDYVVESIRPWK